MAHPIPNFRLIPFRIILSANYIYRQASKGKKVVFVAFKQKTTGKFPETHDGNMPKCRVIYLQCKAVLRGPEKGGILPFSVGKDKFDEDTARKFVNGVDRHGYSYIKRNYPVLCEPAI